MNELRAVRWSHHGKHREFAVFYRSNGTNKMQVAGPSKNRLMTAVKRHGGRVVPNFDGWTLVVRE